MFEVDIKDFTKASAIVCAAIERRNSIPILGTMRATATPGGPLVLEGCNMDMAARVAIPADVSRAAEILIEEPWAVVSAIGAAGSKRASFEPIKGGWKVAAGRLVLSREQQAVEAEDWTYAAECAPAGADFQATFTADHLKQIARVVPAIDREESRYYLHGINVKRLDDWTCRFAATDGLLLMVVDVPMPDALGKLPSELTLPAPFIRAVFQHFRRAAGPIIFKVGGGRLDNQPAGTTVPGRTALPRVSVSGRIGAADVEFTGNVIDGIYPDYSRAIPKSCCHQAIFTIAELRRAVLAISAGMHPPRGAALSFGPDGVAVGLRCGIEGVSAEYRLGCQHNMPDGFMVVFRSTYLMQQLGAMRGKEVKLSVADAASPSLWCDLSDPDFLSVLMPLRLDGHTQKPKG